MAAIERTAYPRFPPALTATELQTLYAPEMLWEWERPHIARLPRNATTFGRELTHQYFPSWDALSQENERIWETYYLPRPAYEPWENWQAWMAEYREIVRDVQEIAEEHADWRGKAEPQKRRPKA